MDIESLLYLVTLLSDFSQSQQIEATDVGGAATAAASGGR